MKLFCKIALCGLPVLAAGVSFNAAPAAAQAPVVVPVIVDTAAPIIVNVVKKKPTGLAKFEGTFVNGNIAEVTVRDKNNELSIQTFSLSEKASAKMQEIVDKGGYQYGDKVTVYYDPATRKAAHFKGKPSKPI